MNTYYNRRGGSRPWRRLRDRVLREQPYCAWQLPGCTKISTVADHVIARADAPHLVMARSNLVGSCRSCNLAKGRKSPAQVLRTRGTSHKQAKALAFFN